MSAIRRIDGHGRERVRAAGQELLDDVVLRRALERAWRRPRSPRRRDDVERQQPGGRRVDRHRRVHLAERDAVQQRVHVALVGDRARRPCRPRRGRARGRGRSRSASAGRTRSTARSGPWRGSSGTARWSAWRRMTRVGAHHPRAVALGKAVLHRSDCMVRARGRPLSARSTSSTPASPGRSAATRSATCSSTPARRSATARCWRSCGDVEPRAVLLTHIHLDHAGATGALVRRWPDLQVWVHERGAPHIIDPSKLVASADAHLRRRHGAAVGRDRRRPRGERARAQRGGRSTRARAGAGSTRPATRRTTCSTCTRTAARRSPATSPACGSTTARCCRRRRRRTSTSSCWRESLDKLEAWEPSALALTHFGAFDNVAAHIAGLREGLDRWGARGPRQHRGGVRGRDARVRRGAGRRRGHARRVPVREPARDAVVGAASLLGEAATLQAGMTQVIERPRTQGPGSGLGRQLERDRPQRRPQHVRPRGEHARAQFIPGVTLDKGYAIADRIHNSGLAVVWSGAQGAGRALLGAAPRLGPDDGPARAVLAR